MFESSMTKDLENRTVITPNSEDVSMLYRSGYNRLGGDLPEYGGWVTPSDLEKGKISKQEQEVRDRIEGSLGDKSGNMTESQMRAVCQTLMGKYGDKVTLVRLNPDLEKVFQKEVEQNPQFKDMRSTNEFSMTLEFMEQDSGLPHGEATRSDAYSGEPNRVKGRKGIDEATPEELKDDERIAKQEFHDAHVKMGRAPDIGEKVKQAKVQAQQQDQQRETFGQKFKNWWKSWTVKGLFKNMGRKKNRQQEL